MITSSIFASTRTYLNRLLIALTAASLLLVSCPDSAFAKDLHFEWKLLHADMVEPPLSRLVGWKLEDVPRNATLYFDMTGDGLADVVFAHPVIAQARAKKCESDNENKLDEYYLTLSTCPSQYPMRYFVTRQYTMFRLLNDNVWSKVMEMVTQTNLGE